MVPQLHAWGGSCILAAEAFYQVRYSLWFYSLLWYTVQIACLLIYSIDNSSVNICIPSCTFDVSYKSNSFLFNTIKNENDIRQHRKKNYDNTGIIQSRKYYMSRFGRKIQTLI